MRDDSRPVVTLYGSFEEMMEDLGRAMDAADAMVTDQQRRYRPGDIVVSDSGFGFPIYNVIQDIEKVVGENLKDSDGDEEDEEDGIYTLDLYREPHMRFYCYSNSYSEACPEGEYGDFHISSGLFRIPREAFEELKKNRFVLGRR
ncbi:MAG: hypothetical protein AB1512_02800 [Thermodesulfobacteriota bacterium]